MMINISLKTKAMLLVGITSFAFMAGLVYAQYRLQNDENLRSLQLRAGFQTDMLASNLAQAIWDMNLKYVRSAAEGALNDEDVERVTIVDNEGKIIDEVNRKDFNVHDHLDIKISKPISYSIGDKSENVGEITLILSGERSEKELVSHIANFAAASSIGLLAYLFLFYGIIYSLLHPVKRIEKTMLGLARGETAKSIPYQHRHDEIGNMSRAIQSFRDTAVRADDLEREVDVRRAVQAELERARVQADSANVAKSQFLANMSHEIRTPLNGVLATAELLGDTTLDQKQRKYVDTIQGSGELLLTLLNDILDLSKIEAGKLELYEEAFDFGKMTEMTVGLFSSFAKTKGLKFIANVPPSIPQWLVADPHRLRQIMSNLLSNAIKYTKEGSIRMELSWAKCDRPDSGDKYCLTFRVTDTGKGISKENIDKLFEKFVQAHKASAATGTGLGLAICKSLVTMMDGKIGVESEVNVGSTFWFSVPLHPSEARETKTEAAIKPIMSPRRAFRILLVEDVEVNRMVVTDMMNSLNCHVETACNGREGVDVCAQKKFDMILMDCNMPVMDGYEATRLIRMSGDEKTPIIAISAHVFSDEIKSCLEAGMNDFLSKPVKKRELANMIGKWCREENDIDSAVVNGLAAAPSTADGVPPEKKISFDVSTLEQWFSDMPDKAKKIVDMTMRDGAGFFDSIEKAVADKSAEDLKSNAHALKSVAAQIGGVGLSEVCKEMEIMGKEGNLSTLDETFGRFKAEYTLFRDNVFSACSKFSG